MPKTTIVVEPFRPIDLLVEVAFLLALPISGYLLGRHFARRGRHRRIESWIGPAVVAGFIGVFIRMFYDQESLPRSLFPLVALSLVAVAIRIGSRRVVNHRRRANLCLTCEYDLRGNISGHCSECGTPIDSVSAASAADDRPGGV